MRYRILILICIISLLFTGCGVSVGDAGDPGWDLSFKDQVKPTEETGPTAPPNPYGPVDFGWENHFKTCLSGESMAGIDVSEWQGDVDWTQVADAGVEYVMIRIGWRGSEEGLMFEDERFREYYDGASNAGLKIGAYFFSQAITVEEAQEEAAFALELLDGRALDLPLTFDWEQLNATDRTGDMDARTLTDCTIAFCEAVEQAGYEAMVYFNPDQASRLVYLGELTDYRFWLAMYTENMTYPYKVDMWQYTDQGTVPGIDVPVDLNLHLIYE